MEIPDELIRELALAVKDQMQSPDTPFVAKTYERLTSKLDLSEEEALELMAQALGIAANRMMSSAKPFDMAFYKAMLSDLPDLPGE